MHKRVWALLSFTPLLALLFSQPQTQEQRFRAMSADAEKKGLADPYKGITTNGEIQPGLYAIRSTGVSTAPVRAAATAFLAALTPDQRAKTTFPVDDIEWRKWMNQDFYVRQCTGFVD